MKRTKIALLIIVIVIAGCSLINPIYPHEQLLQQAGTVLLLAVMVVDIFRGRFSLLAYGCIALFTIVHIIGARYIYSYVPYQEWFSTINLDLNSLFGTTKRNGYDRFVHFAFGFVMLPVLYELVEHKLKRPLVSLLMAWLMIQFGSLIYELFEWSLTIFLSPTDANNYNGQQGDMWDAQKDMALALLGSTITSLFYTFYIKIKRNK